PEMIVGFEKLHLCDPSSTFCGLYIVRFVNVFQKYITIPNPLKKRLSPFQSVPVIEIRGDYGLQIAGNQRSLWIAQFFIEPDFVTAEQPWIHPRISIVG